MLAPYLYWAKTRTPAPIDLAGSNLVHCTMDELPGAREALELWIPNDNGYAPLVESIAAHYGVSTGRVTTAAACSGANFLVAATLVAAGDHVLVERPTYDPLIGACMLMGATVDRFDRRFEDGYRVNPDAVRAAMTPRTKLIILTSPHNPSGIAVDRAGLEGVARVAADTGAHVLVDEVYIDAANAIAGAGHHSTSAASIDGPMIVTSSLTKSYGLAGLRLGWIVASPTMIERIRRTRDVVDNAGNSPSEKLAAHAFTLKARLLDRARGIIGGNVAKMRAFLAEHPMIEVAAQPSCSVTFPRLRGVSDAQPFIDRVLTEHGVALAPGAFFESPAHFRVSLAGKPENLTAGLSRLGGVLRALYRTE